MQAAPPSSIHDDGVSLRQLTDVLWRHKTLVLFFTVIVTAATAVAAFVMPKTYIATIVVSPVSSDSSGNRLGGLSSMMTQIGGLSSLAGISLSENSEKAEAEAVLQSEAVTERYIESNNLIPVLARVEPKITSAWKANAYFKGKIRSITVEAKTGLITMSIAWRDPVLAASWANGLVALTNHYLQDKAIREGERNIAYLNEQASKADAVGVKQAFYSILQSQIGKLMLAKGSEEYALKIIDPAVAPERPTSPRPALWISGALLGSLACSVAIAFIRVAWE